MSEPYVETALFIDGAWVALEPYNREKSVQFLFKHVVINPPSHEQFETEARDLFASLLACSSPVLIWRAPFEVRFDRDFATQAVIGRAYARGVFESHGHVSVLLGTSPRQLHDASIPSFYRREWAAGRSGWSADGLNDASH